jgi:hypothetical protein
MLMGLHPERNRIRRIDLCPGSKNSQVGWAPRGSAFSIKCFAKNGFHRFQGWLGRLWKGSFAQG